MRAFRFSASLLVIAIGCGLAAAWGTSTGRYILMGNVLEKKGEFELAIRALQRAAMDPNNPTTHHLLGPAYRDMAKKRRRKTNST